MRICLLVAVASLLGSLVMSSSAAADIYWTKPPAHFGGSSEIGRADQDGSNAEPDLISLPGEIYGIALDKTYVYWTNYYTEAIGRAKRDGSEVIPAFFSAGYGPNGIAVDGSHIYWTDENSGEIARANLDGTEREYFIIGAENPWGLAIQGQYIYWSNHGAGNNTGSIGRARLDGSQVDQNFIAGISEPAGLVVDAEHIYWAGAVSPGVIGRANLDGSGVEKSFISGLDKPYGLAGDGEHLYWGNSSPGNSMGRAGLDGSNAEPSFVAPLANNAGIAVDQLERATPVSEVGQPAKPPTAPSTITPTTPGTACTAPVVSAATFVPRARPGKVVPGLRAKVKVSTPSQISVAPTISYRAGGAVHRVALAPVSFATASVQKLRLPIPARLRQALPMGTKVGLRMVISTVQSGSSACTVPAGTTEDLKLKVVRVLSGAS